MVTLPNCSVVVGLGAWLLSISCAAAHEAEVRSAIAASHTSAPSMWGSLKPGPYGVGFQRHFVHDRSRIWQLRGAGELPFKADLVGRPIEFNTWYPAAASNHHRAMSLADYYPRSAPPGFALLNIVMETRADWNDTARSTPMAAISNAPPIVGRFPVVLMFGGLGDDINANVVMAEYLASHGMLVVSVSLLGASEEATDPSTDSQGVETTVRDMEYVLSIVDRYSNVDPSRVAAVGHSFGGVEAALLAIRNGSVSAVVGLDATYGFKGMSGSVTEAAGHSADRFRAAFLDIRRAEGIGGAELDLTVLESLHYAERWQVTLPIQHEDFTSRAESGALLFHGSHVPSVVENGKAGYEFVCELLSHFLAHHFSGPGAADYDIEAATHAVQAGYRHWVAETPPVTPWQIWATTIPKGPDAIRARLSEQCGAEDLETCTAINGMAAVGDELGSRGQLRDALVVSQIVAWARPRSVFAQDQLANGYIAVGDVDSYRKALERAIELIPVDPTLKSETKPSFEQMERDKLDRLPPL